MKNITYLFIVLPLFVFSQVGINTTNPQETLHVEGTLCVTNTTTKTPTKLAGLDANGTVTDVVIGNNLDLTGNVLSARGDYAYYKIRTIPISVPYPNYTFNNLFLDVTGANKDIIIFRFVGATSNFSVAGIQGGVDGRHIILYNANTVNMKIDHLSPTSIVSNQMNNLGSATATSGIGTVELVYDGTLAKWIVIDIRD